MQPDKPVSTAGKGPDGSPSRMGCVAFGAAAAVAALTLIFAYVGVAMCTSDPDAQAAAQRLGSRLIWPALLSGGFTGWWTYRGDRGKGRAALVVTLAIILAIPALVALGPLFR